jgi:hypothetical protein
LALTAATCLALVGVPRLAAVSSLTHALSESSDGIPTPKRFVAVTAVTIRNVALEPADRIDDVESTTLSFDVHNESDASVGDIAVSISILDPNEDSSDRRVVVRPFTIRMKEVLLAGYSMHYELRLRNLSADCSCEPAVELIDARVLFESSVDGSPQRK